MRSLEIYRRDVKGVSPDEGLEEQLGDLDVSDQRNGEVDSHTTSAVTLTGITGRTTVVVLGRQVDIHVDQVVRKMLGEGVLRLLLVLGILGKGFEVLKVDMNTI